MIQFLLLLACGVLFAGLAIDALVSHGPRSSAFVPSDMGAPPHEHLTRPVVKRSGRGLAALFLVLSAACLGLAVVLGSG